ncbi:hypothetical protein BDY19DRAFT_921651 [Irpex rosettiformis]|uniref:Uncharacterized protein n=1 Tax=Irpex rosettiformis TaxID=378272 RepID=A0ACB8UFH8_9APHY|nr:hypothetical protein BDY19DRAFT_921651 [Irpex rosettiformis]
MPFEAGHLRVPSTPSTRRSTTIGQVVPVPATPQSIDKNKVQPQTPEQRARRYHELQQICGELPTQNAPPGSRNGGSSAFPSSPRPIGGIDEALSSARISATPQTRPSPLKRSYIELSDDEEQFWQETSGPSTKKPSKLQRTSTPEKESRPPIIVPASSIPSSSKGKGREIPVQSVQQNHLLSDPENPFELHRDAMPESGQTVPAPSASPTVSHVDEVEKFARTLLGHVAEFRKLEEKLFATERDRAVKEKAINELNKQLVGIRYQLEEATETVDAQRVEIAMLREENASLKDRQLHLEGIIEGLHVRRPDEYD